MIKKSILIGSVLTASILVGCGSSSSDTADVASVTGYLVDSPVVNADYDCLTSNNQITKKGKTLAKGAFTCNTEEHIRFKLGNLILGEIDSLPADGYVFPQDLVGVDRNASLVDERVTAIAQLLQSLDDDGNITDHITIRDDVKELLTEVEANFTTSDLQTYLESASIIPSRIPTQTQARDHLRETMQTFLGTTDTNQGAYGNTQEHGNHGNAQGQGIIDQNSTTENQGAYGNGQGYGNHGNAQGQGIIDQNGTLINPSTTTLSTLTPELQDALAYIGNEERLAHDVYTNLYNYHTNKGTEIFQLHNIASTSEINHIQTIQSLVQKYDLNDSDLTNVTDPVADNTILVSDMPSGQYDIPSIQSLYDTLYAKGIASQQDALEVGCMVEVTDINDFNEYIELAKESNAADIEAAFTSLRDASYNHYWAFDSSLKNLGITNGCASAGAEYDHPEYPQNSHGGR
jgi:hypothetical protein